MDSIRHHRPAVPQIRPSEYGRDGHPSRCDTDPPQDAPTHKKSTEPQLGDTILRRVIDAVAVPRLPSQLPDVLGESFSVRAARAEGVSLARLRHRDLDAPFSGVRTRGMPSTEPLEEDESPIAREARARRARIQARATAYRSIMAPGAFFSHVTAAVLWGIPVPLRLLRGSAAGDRPPVGTIGPPPPHPAAALLRRTSLHDRPLDVAVVLPNRGPRMAGVRTHRLAPALVTTRTHGGLLLASPASTWTQLAESLTVDELIVAGDAIVHEPRRPRGLRGEPGCGLATLPQLAAAVDAGRRIGIAKLREALPQTRVGSASPPETDLRLAILRAGLPAPELDVDVFDENGALIGYTELGYPTWMILIEFEGDHHRTSRTQWDRDIEKHARCVALGWTVLRFTARHVYPSSDAAVTGIRDALLRKGWRPLLAPDPR